uniref:E3 ubiquitin protein ligase n=2 Tax=Spongospora subterranea TaxID=70186 RepID=A0A0H5R749_9EUKA|eukprot:CRZ04119.1 hypothetical protein [Spongospora subterranea]
MQEGGGKRPRSEAQDTNVAGVPADITDPESLLRYQNKKQSQLLRERARTINTLQDQVAALHKAEASALSQLKHCASSWVNLQANLTALLRRCVDAASLDSTFDGSKLFQSLTQGTIDDQSQDSISLLRILCNALSSQEQKIQSLVQSAGSSDTLDSAIRSIVQQQQEKIQQLEITVNGLDGTEAALTKERILVNDANRRILSLEAELDEKSSLLREALKHIDRLDLTPSADNNGLLSVNSPQLSDKTSDVATSVESTTVANAVDAAVIADLQQKLAAASEICDMRMQTETSLQERYDKLYHTLQDHEAASIASNGRAIQAELAKDVALRQITDLKAELLGVKAAAADAEATFQSTLEARSVLHSQQLCALQAEATSARQSLVELESAAQRASAQASIDTESCKTKLSRLTELEALCSNLGLELQRRSKSHSGPSATEVDPDDLNAALMSELDEMAHQYDELSEMNARLQTQMHSVEDCNTQLVAAATRLQQTVERDQIEKRLLLEKESKLKGALALHADSEAALVAQVQVQIQVSGRLQEMLQTITAVQEEHKEIAVQSAAKVGPMPSL